MNNYSIVKIISVCGNTGYFIKGTAFLHREDGPAFESVNGNKLYYLHGKFLKDVKTDEELIIKLLLE